MDPTKKQFCEELTNTLIQFCIEKNNAAVYSTMKRRCEVHGVLFRDGCLQDPQSVDKKIIEFLTTKHEQHKQ